MNFRLYWARACAIIVEPLLVSGLSLGLASPSLAAPKNDELPTAVVSTQKYILKDPRHTQLSITLIEGDTPQAAFQAYVQATRRLHPELKDPYSDLQVTGIFAKESDTRILQDFLPHPVADRSSAILWDEDSESDRAPSSVPADQPKKLSRIELLKNFESILPKIRAEKMAELTAKGDAIAGARYKKSPKRFALIAVRTLTVGIGSAGAMVLANSHSDVVWSMFANGIYTGASVQMSLDWLRNQYTYVQGWERKLVNLFLRPFGYRWQPGANTTERAQSSYGASMMKWYSTEVAVNEVNRLHGYLTYKFLVPDAQTVVNGIAQVPSEFQLVQGAVDGSVVGLHTLATQGVYEKIFNDEYIRRTFPYHVQAAYYTDLLKQTSDPELIRKYESIIESSITHSISERVWAGSFANIGSASWITALGLQSHANPLYSKIASYSLLPIGGGLNVYFNWRRKQENEILGIVPEDKKRSFGRLVSDSCRSKLHDITAWAKEFKSEIQRIRPAPEKGVGP